jgi:hypothetical protein
MADEPPGRGSRIQADTGVTAPDEDQIARVARDAPAGEIVRALQLQPAQGLVVLNGSTTDDEPDERLRALLTDGLARLAADDGLTVVTGGTDAGVFALFGSGLGDQSPVACIGVAPLGRVTWPGRTDPPDDAVALEPHHSHFVLVDGDAWGDETGTMLRLAAALAGDGASVAVLAGGGEGAKRELLGHVRAGRDVVVLSGTGRVADDVAVAVAAGGSRDPQLNEVAAGGHAVVFDVAGGPDAFREVIRKRLSKSRAWHAPALLRRFPTLWYRDTPPAPVVSYALRAELPLLDDELAYLERTVGPRYRALDRAALRAQHAFRLTSLVLILGSAIATSLGAAQTASGGGSLSLGVAEAVVAALVSGMVVYARGRGFQQTYLQNRVAAERVKSQYYLFVARAGIYALDNDAQRGRQLELALNAIAAGEEPA